MKLSKILLAALPLLLFAGSFRADAQRLAVSANAADLLMLGTMNAEVDWALGQHYSIEAQFRYNPWTFFKGNEAKQSELRRRTVTVGSRWWPWYVYSGAWAGTKLQWQEYNMGGFNGKIPTEEGDAFGLGLEAGYALMLSHQLNINFGLGFWTGAKKYVRYSCPYCGRRTEEGWSGFFAFNEAIVALVYVF